MAQRFSASGQKERVAMLYPTAQSKKMCAKLGLPATPLRLRLIRIDLNTKEPEVLITSLMDTSIYPHSIFKELYHERWLVEESYKLFKSRIELENFTEKSTEAIKQDFYTLIFMVNLTSILAFPVQDQICEQHKDKKYSSILLFLLDPKESTPKNINLKKGDSLLPINQSLNLMTLNIY